MPDNTNYRYEDGLESARLRTRFLREEDADIWEGFYMQEGNDRYLLDLGGKTPKENARLAVERQLNRYKRQTYGLQALIEKSTGSLVGQCGLLQQEIKSQRRLEIGYQLFNDYWGKGFATEAACLFRDYGFRELDAPEIIAIINVDNLPSQRVATRIGMTQSDEMDYLGHHTYIYQIDRDSWLLL